MKKIFIIISILFCISINNILAQKTSDEYNDSGVAKSELDDYQGAIDEACLN